MKISKKRLCAIVLIVGALAAVAAMLFLSDNTVRAVVVSLCLVCVMLTLPTILRTKRRRNDQKSRQTRDSRLDAHRLMPQDKGKIIPFPGNKK